MESNDTAYTKTKTVITREWRVFPNMKNEIRFCLGGICVLGMTLSVFVLYYNI